MTSAARENRMTRRSSLLGRLRISRGALLQLEVDVYRVAVAGAEAGGGRVDFGDTAEGG